LITASATASNSRAGRACATAPFRLPPLWAERLGEDRTISIEALGAISETALTRNAEIAFAADGLPNTFVPGRNLLFLTFAAALAYRRGIADLVGGMCETDYSGYPDCRDQTIRAMAQALSLGMDRSINIHTPLMWIDKAAPGDWRNRSAANRWCGSSSKKPIPAISAREARFDWAMAAANARPASCARGWENYRTGQTQRTAETSDPECGVRATAALTCTSGD
jgi:7-cyano-7-deazaguanine synthase